MTARTYFAYGSNMSTPRLRERAASARPLGRAWLPDMRLTFNKPARDGSGKANLVAAPGSRCWGVLFELEADEFERLDRYEPGYVRRTGPVFADFGPERAIEAEFYLYEHASEEIPPCAEYLRHLLDGAREHALPEEFSERLRRVRCRAV